MKQRRKLLPAGVLGFPTMKPRLRQPLPWLARPDMEDDGSDWMLGPGNELKDVTPEGNK